VPSACVVPTRQHHVRRRVRTPPGCAYGFPGYPAAVLSSAELLYPSGCRGSPSPEIPYRGAVAASDRLRTHCAEEPGKKGTPARGMLLGVSITHQPAEDRNGSARERTCPSLGPKICVNHVCKNMRRTLLRCFGEGRNSRRRQLFRSQPCVRFIMSSIPSCWRCLPRRLSPTLMVARRVCVFRSI